MNNTTEENARVCFHIEKAEGGGSNMKKVSMLLETTF
jgi:hypothetical protein